MRFSGVFFLIFFVQITQSLNIVSPTELKKYVNSPATGQNFGPQTLSPTEGTAIYFKQDICSGIVEGKVGGPEVGNYSGYIVVAEYFQLCRYSQVYRNMLRTQAIAVIVVDDFPIPGITYYIYGASSVKFQNEKIPFLQASKIDMASVLKVIKDKDYNNSVVVQVYLPDRNRWKEVLDSVEVFILFKVILPIICFSIAILAFYSFVETVTSVRTTMTNTKNTVFLLEGISMVLLGFFVAANGLVGSFFSYEQLWYFFSGFPSIGMFTTIIVAMFYRRLNIANREVSEMKDIFQLHPIFICLSFIFFCILEVIGGVLANWALNPIVTLVVVGLMISFLNVVAGIFMLKEKIFFYKEINLSAQNYPSSTKNLVALCEYTGRWLVASTGFMLLSTGASIALATPVFLIPNGCFIVATVGYFARCGTSFTQIMALRWKQKLHQSQDKGNKAVAVWSKDSYINSLGDSQDKKLITSKSHF